MALRAAIMLTALGLGAAMLQTRLAMRIGKWDPTGAAQLAPGNAHLAAEAARVLATGKEGDRRKSAAFARAALARDPTLTPAMEALALAASQEGRDAQTRRLFALSSQISRRSLATRVWLIQQAVENGDAPAALAHMDIALRTSPQARTLIFPAFEKGLTDPELIKRIAHILDRPSEWREAFLLDAAGKGDPAGMAALLMTMRDRSVVIGMDVDRAVVDRLVSERQFRLARRLASAVRPSRSSGLVIDGDFAGPAGHYPFGWKLRESGGIGAAPGNEAGKPVLAYHAKAGQFGQLAVQLLMLPPDNYRLASVTARPGKSAPFWTADCGEEGGSRIASLEVSPQAGGTSSRDFIVAAGCEAQWLALNLKPSDDAEQGGAIASVSIERR